jgi:hypothetical protein
VADSLKRQTTQLKSLSSGTASSNMAMGLGTTQQKQSMSRLSAKKEKLPINQQPSINSSNSTLSLIKAPKTQSKGKLVKGINYDV